MTDEEVDKGQDSKMRPEAQEVSPSGIVSLAVIWILGGGGIQTKGFRIDSVMGLGGKMQGRIHN